MKKFISNLIFALICVYVGACIIDICAPVMSARGSDWNLIAEFIKWALRVDTTWRV